MELIEEEIEIYNAKMRLLNWIYEELKFQPEEMREKLNKIGQELPLNI